MRRAAFHREHDVVCRQTRRRPANVVVRDRCKMVQDVWPVARALEFKTASRTSSWTSRVLGTCADADPSSSAPRTELPRCRCGLTTFRRCSQRRVCEPTPNAYLYRTRVLLLLLLNARAVSSMPGVCEVLNNKTHSTTRAGGVSVVARGRQAAYGARPMESRKLMAAAACRTEVASADTMAAEMAAVW